MSEQGPSIPNRELTCKDVHDFLMAYLDNEVTAQQRQAFEEHLAACSSCVRYVDQYQRTIRLGREAICSSDEPATTQVPAGLIDAIRNARKRG